MNKKGEEGSFIRTLIALIIVLIVGFFLIWGFSTNWKFWRSSVSVYTSSNVDSVVVSCKTLCKQGEAGRADFCSVLKKVNFGQEIEYSGKRVSSVKLSCRDLARDFSEYGFEDCFDYC